MQNTIQSQARRMAHEKIKVVAGSIKGKILLQLWREGSATRKQIFDNSPELVGLSPDTNAGRFTELSNEGLIKPVGIIDGYTVYILTAEGKEVVKKISNKKLRGEEC